jgi:hypothetical protein
VNVSLSADVIVGQDGWLFLAGGSNDILRFYTNPDHFDEATQVRWAAVLAERSERCRSMGIEYLHMTAPDKLSVYGDKAGVNISASPLSTMSAYLRRTAGTQASWLDIGPAMREARKTADLYWKTDTHWNFNGAFAAYRELCQQLGAPVSEDLRFRESEVYEIPLDLGGKLVPAVTETFEVKRLLQNAQRSRANDLVRIKELRKKENEAGWHVGSDVTFTNNWPGKDPRRVMIFGDSFSEYRPFLLTGLLAETFAETRFVWSTQVDWAEVDKFKPDILITEIAERFMRQVPDDVGFSLEALVAEKLQRLDKNLLVFGDSHVHTMQWAANQGMLSTDATFVPVGGATAVGMRNPNSLTNALQIFEDAAIPVRPKTVPVIHLGEVDCGFVIWWRAAKYGEPIEAQVDASIGAYFSFVDRLLAAGYPTVIITAASPPTIKDGQDWGEIANLRKEVSVSIQDRTALTLRYNCLLRAEATRRGLPFVDASESFIDQSTGVIRERFRHADPLDHHLSPETAGPIWAEAINTAIGGI